MSENELVATWFAAEEGQAHEPLTRTVRAIRQNQQYRKVQDLLHASLYGNLPLIGFGWSALSRPAPLTQARLSLNVVRNMTAAVTSKIAAKNKPQPKFEAEGGGGDFWELKQKCEKLEKFVSGVFYEAKFYELLPLIFRDACVFGTGFVRVYEDEKQVCIDRILPWEVIVDDGEAMYGCPPNLYIRKYFDRQQLLAVAERDWGAPEEALAIIRTARCDYEDNEFGYQTTSDQLLVTEAWHLPTSSKGEGGRHIIAIDGVTLLDEGWDEPSFPVMALRWSKPLLGYFGVGLAEELTGIQTEINKLLLEIQRGHHLIKGHYLVENGSKVVGAHLNNDLAAIVRYTGIAPQYQTPTAIAPDVYQHLWNLYQKAYEITGISQLSASSQKPAGLDAAVAIEAFHDIESERFQEVGQTKDEFVLDVARAVISSAKRVAASGSFRVKARGKNTFETIDWKDVDLPAEKYVLKMYPASMLPSTPAGKRQWVMDMLKLGQMPPEDVFETVGFTDVEEYARRKNAARMTVKWRIGRMLNHGEYRPPEPFDPHALALRLVNEAYHEALQDGYPEDRLELLRTYMKSTKDYMPGPAPAPLPGGPPAPPPGVAPPPPMPSPFEQS